MADSVVRLKVENSEYDAKIKRAAQGLQHLEDACHKAGGTLAILDDADKRFVQSLGRMETVSRSARGRIGELTAAFTDLRVQYNRLSDEEKKGDYGKALSASLDQLRTRINENRAELQSINSEIQENGSVLDRLSGKIGLNASELMSWGSALAAGKIALDVLKDAFFSNEEQLDEWGRIVQSSESVYNGFLDALNTGDISGFLNRISQIVNAARDAYDALDELATYNAFNQVNVEKARTNLTESMADYRSGTGSKDKVKAAGEEMKKQLQERARMEADAYNKAIDNLAAQRGVSAADLRKAMSGTYGDYKTLKDVQMTGISYRTVGGSMFGGGQVVQERYAKTEQERLGAALRRVNDTELQTLQALGAQAQRTATEVAQVDKQTARVLAGGGRTGGGGRSGGGRTSGGGTLTDKLVFKTKFITEDEESKYLMQVLKKNETGSAAVELGLTGAGALSQLESLVGYQGDGEKTFTKFDFDRAEFLKKQEGEGKSTQEIMQEALSGIQQITSGLATIGIDLPEEINGLISTINGLMSIVQGVSTVISVFSAGSQTANTTALVANTASATALTSAVIANTSALIANSATNFIPFANGGVVRAASGFVGGRKYSGDNIPALLNSGETVLNAAQTSNLATKLNNNAQQKMNAQPYLDCEKIYLGLKTYLGATGRGELVFTG